uniref:Uncharacterized protein n=1 Tax=Arundo donax TaxID=35708 RepID=A0A0A9C3C8_ARUDO
MFQHNQQPSVPFHPLQQHISSVGNGLFHSHMNLNNTAQ